ncbi:MAG: hypothetical protein JKY02_07870 [Flavobacteriaceae bacterium]|nr:hypothetical protein [Flavobacteriaceae bacterium]
MKKLFFVLLLISLQVQSQEANFFENFQAMRNSGIVFYNVHGTTITTESYSYRFNEKGLKRAFRKYKFNFKKTKKQVDSELGVENYYIKEVAQVVGDYKSYTTVYFVRNKEFISVLIFSGVKELQSSFSRNFIRRFLDYKIPETVYVAPKIDSIQFVKRYIKLGPSCQWMGVRNVQCPYNGQMDWTLHESLEDAKEFNKIREAVSTSQRKLKRISRDSIDVTFEGKKTKAIKIVYDIKGIQSLLVNMSSGAKNLIVYYIAETIRGKYVSCILSHWDNDRLQPNGLPALLGEVIELPKQ